MRRLSAASIGVLAALLLALPAAASAGSTGATSVVQLSAPVSGLRYDQKVVRAHAGTIKIVFLNRSTLKHNVNVEHGEKEFGKTATVAHGTVTMTVRLKAGKYNFYCSVPGHEDAGMHGTLVVT
jgi:plastocyanin